MDSLIFLFIYGGIALYSAECVYDRPSTNPDKNNFNGPVLRYAIETHKCIIPNHAILNPNVREAPTLWNPLRGKYCILCQRI